MSTTTSAAMLSRSSKDPNPAEIEAARRSILAHEPGAAFRGLSVMKSGLP